MGIHNKLFIILALILFLFNLPLAIWAMIDRIKMKDYKSLIYGASLELLSIILLIIIIS